MVAPSSSGTLRQGETKIKSTKELLFTFKTSSSLTHVAETSEVLEGYDPFTERKPFVMLCIMKNDDSDVGDVTSTSSDIYRLPANVFLYQFSTYQPLAIALPGVIHSVRK